MPTDDTEYMLATDNQNNNKLLYLPKKCLLIQVDMTLKQDAKEDI